jgi:hypothetical protein
MRQAPHDDARIFERPPLDEDEEAPEVNAEDQAGNEEEEERPMVAEEVPLVTILRRLLASIPEDHFASVPDNVIQHI